MKGGMVPPSAGLRRCRLCGAVVSTCTSDDGLFVADALRHLAVCTPDRGPGGVGLLFDA